MANGKNIQLLVAVFSLLIDGGLSRTATDASCSDVGQVQYVQVFEVGSTLVVVWQAPIGADDCSLAYNVTYSSRLSAHTDITEELHYTFDYNSYPCDLGQISITPVIEGGEMENAVHIEEYSADIGGVSNITFRQEDGLLHVTWSDPPNTDLCDFTYQIEYVDENNYTDVVETYGREFTFESDLTPCLISNLSITPLSGTKMGLSTSKTHEADVGPVKNFVLNSSNGELFAKWDPPANTHMCILSYEVAQNETGCFTKSINVKAISNSGKQGMVQSGEIETEIPAVTNLDVQFSKGIVTISWVRPENVGDCDVKYAVQFDEWGIYDTYDTRLIIEANPLLCQTARATVWPVSSTGNFGVQASANYEREIGSVKALSLKPNGDQLVATWAPPADSELCTFSYLLEYNDGSGTHITVSDDTSFSFGYSSCQGAEITVTAHTASGLMGAATHATCEEVSDIGPVTNLMIQNVGGMLEITWQSPQNADEFGPITYNVNYNGEDHQAIDTAYTVEFSEIQDLPSCSVVVFTVTAVSDSGEGLGVAVKYNTGVGGVVGLTIEEVDGAIQLLWSKPEVDESCAEVIAYNVNYNGEDHQASDTAYTVEFTEIQDLPSCSVVVFTVTAVTDSAEGLGVAIKYNTGVGGVIGLTIEKVDEEIQLLWSKPEVDENCGELIKYKINYNDEDYTEIDTKHTVDLSNIPNPSSCSVAVFTVTAVTDSGEGLNVSIKYNTGVGGVTGLTIEEVDGVIQLLWSKLEVDQSCAEVISYKINYNDEDHTEIDTKHTVDLSNIPNPSSCSVAVFTVTAVTDFGEGLDVSIKYNTGVGGVTGLTIEKIDGEMQLLWSKPEVDESCADVISYKINYNDEDHTEIDTKHTVDLSKIPDPSSCSVVVFTVTAVTDSGEGLDVSIKYNTGVGGVTGLIIEKIDEEIQLLWSKPEVGQSCAEVINYKINYNDEDHTEIDTKHTVDLSKIPDPSSCFVVVFTVTAVTDYGEGLDVSIKYNTGVGGVTGLIIEKIDGEIQLLWSKPEVDESCAYVISYKVNYNDEDYTEIDTKHIVDLWKIPDPSSCSVVVFTVTAVTDSGEGLDVSIKYNTGVGGVTGLTIEEVDGVIQLLWSKPEVDENCGEVTSYKINYNDEEHTAIDTKYIIDLSNIPDPTLCFAVMFTVTAVTDSGEGLDVSIKYKTDCPDDATAD